MEPLGASLPFGATHRAHEDALGHALTMREKDLRAAALDLRLVSVRRGEIWERRLRPDARAPLEDTTVAALVRVRAALHPLGRAFRTPEGAIGLVEASPFDNPVLAAV